MPQRLPLPHAFLALIAMITLSAARAHAGPGDMYVTSDASNQTRQYNGTSGAYQSLFTTAFAANGQLGIHFGATNNRVLIGHWTGGVEEFNATTGAYIKTYNPGGGSQWAGLYAPTGGVYIGDWSTSDVREYDSSTGAFIRVVTSLATPADMRLSGNRLYIASFNGGFVQRVNATTGAFNGLFGTPPTAQPNDIAILPSGDILVTCMRTDLVYRYDPTFNLLGSFGSTGWVNPHGIEISPNDGNIYVVEGGAGQVHSFDPVTFAELNPAWLTPAPGDKVVDLDFRPQPGPTPALPPTWGRIKQRYR
jgi:outer membrane protein assembly factor BamB